MCFEILGVYACALCDAGTKKRGINPAARKKLLAAIKEKLPGAS
jgi:hypothetical protein